MVTAWRAAQRILGMNARNLVFIRTYNSATAIKTANNKLATKECLLAAGLPSAKLYGVIRNRKELFSFDWSKLPPSFVLKPNFGLGGAGIFIVYGQDRQHRFIGGGETVYSLNDIRRHVSNILDGNYSLSNIPDIAFFEERLKLSEHFKPISYQGVPDIRVVVFNNVPVMAMLRLPTKQSQGKANLHIGGLGVGIDLISGKTTFAVSKLFGDIMRHPDTQAPLGGVQIPDWDTILRLSAEAAQAIGLGYAGVDIVIDKTNGPMILEINGHPGLEIQNANRLSLRDRLERVAGLTIPTVTKGLKVSRELFGKEETGVAGQGGLGQPVLGIFETIQVRGRDNSTHTIRALVDTGLASTTITKDLAVKLGYTEAMQALEKIVLPGAVAAERAQQVEESFRQTVAGLHPDIVDIVAVRSGSHYIIRPKLPLQFTLGKKPIATQVAVVLDNKLPYPMVLGRRDLVGFLINPGNAV